MGKLKAGIIGCGRIVEEGHIPAFLNLKDKVKVVALAGHRAKERLKIIGEMLGVPERSRYLDYRQMIEKEDLDFVDIAVPHFLHKKIVIDCAEAKLNILLEKPMATNMEEADEILTAVEESSVKLCVLHNYRYQSHYALSLKLIKEGKIGNPFMIRSETLGSGHWSGAQGEDPHWRTNLAKSGGGVLIDNGYHNIYLAEAFMGSAIKTVYARIKTYVRPIDADDTAMLILTHENGAISSVQAAWSVKASQNVCEIYGDKGTIRLSYDKKPIGIYTDHWDYPDIQLSDWGFKGIFKDFVQSLIDNTEPPVTGKEAKRNLKIIMAGYESSRTGKEIEV